MHFRCFLALSLLVSAAATALADGGDSKFMNAPVVVQDPLSKDTTEVELLGGHFESPIEGRRAKFDYASGDFRLGIVVSPILLDKCSLLRGDIEVLGDAFGDGVTDGAGNYLTGGSALFRYNFFHPGSRFIPYFQLGAGGLHSDAAEDRTQKLIGGNFEFILEADIGARILLNDRWSILMEGGFQHISNADTAARNVGVNALGGRMGFGWIY